MLLQNTAFSALFQEKGFLSLAGSFLLLCLRLDGRKAKTTLHTPLAAG
jgi:hypothetical protein